MVTGDHPITA